MGKRFIPSFPRGLVQSVTHGDTSQIAGIRTTRQTAVTLWIEADDIMLVGLTGQMGAGKTTLAGHLRSRGARVVDADQLGHEMLERPVVKRGLEQAFGTEVIGEDGKVDRRALANLAFQDAAAVSSLNQIVGEPLNTELWKRVEHARGTADEIVVVDAALLVEWGMQSRFDTVVVVIVEEEESVIRRLESNRGLERDEILRRLKAQGPVEAKLAVADFVVHNDGDPEAFKDRADALWLDLEQLRDSAESTRN